MRKYLTPANVAMAISIAIVCAIWIAVIAAIVWAVTL